YLVSQSLEQGKRTPILGLEKYFNDKIAAKQLANVFAWAAPGRESKSTTHGGFDDDQVTMMSVISLMKGNAL
ncbi:MAG: peptidase C1A papain, partial [Nitrospirae bacterium]|nr:peptidase C1A papain [Nitrospirota bacterium]